VADGTGPLELPLGTEGAGIAGEGFVSDGGAGTDGGVACNPGAGAAAPGSGADTDGVVPTGEGVDGTVVTPVLVTPGSVDG
jgi:hypothetical protein